MKRALPFAALTVLLALAACDGPAASPDAQTGPNPQLPDQQQYLMPPMKVGKVVPWGNSMPTPAPGLQVQALATGLEHPRQVYPLPNGDVLVVESNGPPAPVFRPKEIIMGLVQGSAGAKAKSANRITLLRDADGDGKYEQRSVFLDRLNSPFGVALVGNDLYVANADALIRFPYVTGDTRITAPGQKLVDLPGGPINHHWTKSLVASPDGSKLYVGVGSNSNITENGIGAELNRAAVWEIDRASGAWKLYAGGLRNPAAVAIEPQSHAVWTAVNERDELGPNLVPDYITSLRPGGFYGWPYSYYGRHIDPRVKPTRPDLVASALVPDYALGSHVAPLGLAFANNGGLLPDTMRNGAFVGEHGSWDRDPFNGYRVVFVGFANGRPVAKPVDVLTGFLDRNNTVHGRPVGVAMDTHGALLVADDVGNTVWRVSAKRP
ncbi:sorbosone dehydrogenase family protein [Novosphingobium sp.]|uniref:PQQ-dependent sugar dehydrogenase n=1 Tax=Novosphingobium sp. TaxID=1874826 RepID=UPI0031D8656C